jgi:hypothetical protein
VKWKSWRKKHPGSLVLSDQTGYQRDYSTDPYSGYYRIGRIMFPVGDVRKDLTSKERIVGVVIGNNVKAYPVSVLTKKSGVITDTIGSATITIHISEEKEITALLDANNKPLPHLFSYWFAWQAFHPETTVYKGE